MTLLPNTRIPVPPPLGYRWHLTPSIHRGAILDLHLDEDPEYDGGWLSKRERRAIRAVMANSEPPLTHIGTPVAKERHVRRVSKRLVRKHYEEILRKARWQVILDEFEVSGAGASTARALRATTICDNGPAGGPVPFGDDVVLPTGPTPPGGLSQPRDKRYRRS